MTSGRYAGNSHPVDRALFHLNVREGASIYTVTVRVRDDNMLVCGIKSDVIVILLVRKRQKNKTFFLFPRLLNGTASSV